MYESPIELIVNQMTSQIMSQRDNQITAKIEQQIGIKVDKEELMKALTYDRNTYQQGYIDGMAAGAEKAVLDFAYKVQAEIKLAIESAEKAMTEREEKHDVNSLEDPLLRLWGGKISALLGIDYFIDTLLKIRGYKKEGNNVKG